MNVTEGYRIYEQLDQRGRYVLYRALHRQDNSSVIIKTHEGERPVSFDMVGLIHEYSILKDLNIEGIPQVCAFDRSQSSLALIIEDPGGEPLRKLIRSGWTVPQNLGIPQLLQLAVSMTETLGELHKRGIVHKDFKPDNLLVDTRTANTWLIDVSSASALPRGTVETVSRGNVKGNPYYMSPEQTGRMDRTLDYRTDFYSLGVTLYEILTGRLPFDSTDPLEVVHGHIALQPAPPHRLYREIPKPISDIVMKLLAKNPDDRYQSSEGLKSDLQECLQQLDSSGGVAEFSLGSKDVPPAITIPKMLYGRENEAKILRQGLDNAQTGTMQLIMISGYSGIGKTSLVREFNLQTAKKRAFFVDGKCDQLHRNSPYGALLPALQKLIWHVLTESENSLNAYRDDIQEALGNQGQVLVDVIPDLHLVLGPQPPVKKLEPEETQNRFNRVFLNFLRVFCSEESPLVVFLDDLQWVDSGTLKMIELIVSTKELTHLFLIGAYRDKEVGPAHPLSSLLAKWRQQEELREIRLDRLGVEHITEMLSHTLHRDPNDVQLLAELVSHKTDGNPFFLRQFLKTLHQERLLLFDEDQGQWQWNLESIRHLPSTDNVVDLILCRLERVPSATRHALKMASCLGSHFDSETLSLITGTDREDTLKALLPALEQDLVACKPGTMATLDGDSGGQLRDLIKFQHDRIQQAAYALIDENAKLPVHLDIARTLLQTLEQGKREEMLFDILSHFNIAAVLIDDPRERERVAELNLAAGKKSKASAAFDPAFGYLDAGIKLLQEDCWEVQPVLALQMHTECMEAARLSGRFPEGDALFKAIKDNAHSTLDLFSAYKSQIRALMAQNRLPEAMDKVHEILGRLGESLPLRPGSLDIHTALEETLSNLSGQSIEGLAELPEMSDPIKLGVLTILDTAISCAYIGEPELFPFVVCKQVDTCIEHGNTTDSAFAYAAFGAMLCKIKGDMESGRRFGELAYNLANRFQDKESLAKVYHAVSGYVDHWNKGLRDTFELALAGYESGIDSGDFEFAGYNAYVYGKHSLLVGNSLAETEQEMASYSETLKHLWQQIPFNYINIFRQTALNLMGRSKDPSLLVGDAYDEHAMLPHHRKTNDNLAVFYVYVCKLMLCYLFGDYRQAVMNSDCAAEGIARAAGGPAAYPLQIFYDSLARTALYESASNAEQALILERVAANQGLLKRWALHAPANYKHKFHLVEAERSRVLGMDEQVLNHLDRAIALAMDNGFVNEESLANELGAAFAMRKGWSQFAEHFAHRAHYCYALWGASAKLRQFELAYEEFLGKSVGRPLERALETSGLDTRPEILSSGVDIRALLKASEAISSEIELDSLLQALMRVVIENAGADRGLLILKYRAAFGIAAEGTAGGPESVFAPPLDIDACDVISPAIVNYVIRTQEVLVLNDLEKEDRFVTDTYLQRHKPHSILCTPIVFQSKLVGTLYLENRLAKHAFSKEHLEVIGLLTTRMASAIENARLYDDLRKAEEKYRSIFENAVEGIYRTTPEGQFIDLNPSAARLLGYETPEKAMADIADIGRQSYVHPEDRDELLSLLRKGRFVTGFEASMYHKDGRVIWVSINARPEFDGEGRLAAIEGFISDVTERRHATDLLIQSEENLRKENIILKSNIKDRYRFGPIVGKSQAMQEVYALIAKAAATEANVIVYGESGTGKELVAKAVHETSARRDRPFVPVNCGAIPENLMESEFFGYKKGAFTGAIQDRPGFLDQSEGGTLFLDELGEIPVSLQVKLLRVLEGGGFTPLGGHKFKVPDVRIIAATHRDLEREIRKGQMREDFFYRIHIIPIHLPALRERREDIPLLVEHFLCYHFGSEDPPKIPGRIIDALMDHDWPGNIRELQNTVHRYIALHKLDFMPAEGRGSVDVSHEQEMDRRPRAVIPLRDAIAEFERVYIRRLLEEHRWNRGKVARILGVDRKTLYRKIARHVLREPQNVPYLPYRQ